MVVAGHDVVQTVRTGILMIVKMDFVEELPGPLDPKEDLQAEFHDVYMAGAGVKEETDWARVWDVDEEITVRVESVDLDSEKALVQNWYSAQTVGLLQIQSSLCLGKLALWMDFGYTLGQVKDHAMKALAAPLDASVLLVKAQDVTFFLASLHRKLG